MAAEVQRTAIFKSIINLHPFKAEREYQIALFLIAFQPKICLKIVLLVMIINYGHYARTLLFWNIYKLPVFFYCVSW